MMNKVLKAKSLFLTAFLVAGCKTSGDLRAEKMSKDPGEIRTIGEPVQQTKARETHAPQAQSSQVGDEDMARQIEVLKGQLQEKDYLHQQEKTQWENRIQALEAERSRLLEEVQILQGTAPATASKGGDLLWEAAQRDIKNRKYAEAAVSLKDFINNFPNDPRVEDAQILKGQSEYASDQFKATMVTFGAYLDKYPKGKGRAMAWLGQGAALIRMKQKKDSKLFLEQCVSLHPKSKEARLARRLLKTPNYVPPEIFL